MTTFESIGIIQLTGSECFTFLNNQTISKIVPSEDTTCHYSAICNPKGRVLFSFFVFTDSESIAIALPEELTDELFNYLNMRRFRMDVQVTKSDQLTLALTEGLAANNQYPLQLTEKKQVTETISIWPTLFSWNLPWIEKEQQEKHIPQHLSLDEAGVIDFKKGCYPGQEIVARLHYLGTVKKRLKLLKVDSQGVLLNNDDKKMQYKWCSNVHMHRDSHFRQAVVTAIETNGINY